MNSRFDFLSGAQRLSPFSMKQRNRNNETGFSLTAGGEGKEEPAQNFMEKNLCLTSPSRACERI